MLLNIYAPDPLGYCTKRCILCSKELEIYVACRKIMQRKWLTISLENNLDGEEEETEMGVNEMWHCGGCLQRG